MRLLRMLPWLLVVAACSSPAAKQTPAAARGATVFEGARLITGDGSAPIENAVFVVENARFAAVGKKGELQIPAGATHVDLTGKTVMPAMVDLHSHLGFLKQSDGSMSKANFNRENILDHLNRYAYHGFAAVISSGTDMGELPYQLREEVHPDAALFRTVGRGLAWPGSGPFDPARNDVPYSVTTEAEARAAVRDLAPHHPDFVKIWVDDRNGRQKKLTPPLYTAAADEAHKQNLRAIAHVFDLEDAKGLVRAGVVGFMHMVRDSDIDDEMIALLKAAPGDLLRPEHRDHLAGSRRGPAGMARRAAAARDHSSRTDPEARAVVHEQKARGARPNTGGLGAGKTQHRQAESERRHAGSRKRLGGGSVPYARLARDLGSGEPRGGWHPADGSHHHVHQDRSRNPAARSARHGGQRQERRLHRPRREPVGQHLEHPQNLGCLSERSRGRSRGDAREMEGRVDESVLELMEKNGITS